MRLKISKVAAVAALALGFSLVPQISQAAVSSPVITIKVQTNAPTYKIGQPITFQVKATSYTPGGYSCASIPSAYVYLSGNFCYANAKRVGAKVPALQNQVIVLDGTNTKSVSLIISDPRRMTHTIPLEYTSAGYWSTTINTGIPYAFYPPLGPLAYKVSVVTNDGNSKVTFSAQQPPVTLVK